MWNLDESRMRELRSFAIENQRLNDLHYRAEAELTHAAEAETDQRWGDFVRHTRAAFGLESRAYPDVKSTQNDVIQGIIFFMALVIPCAFFTERLIFTAATIRNQIIGFAGVFLAIWIVLWLVHPAFQLSNPFVILLAFIIIALAVLVMSIISGRFKRADEEAAHRGSRDPRHGCQPILGLADGLPARDFQHEAAQDAYGAHLFYALAADLYGALFHLHPHGLAVQSNQPRQRGSLRGHPHPQQGVESNGGFSPRIRPQQFRRSGCGRAAQLVQQ